MRDPVDWEDVKQVLTAAWRLADTEWLIVHELMEGRGDTRQLAAKLDKSENTVSAYCSRIQRRAGIQGRAGIGGSAWRLYNGQRSVVVPKCAAPPVARTAPEPVSFFAPIEQKLASPDGLPRLLEPSWLGDFTWADVVRGYLYPRPEIVRLVERLQSDPAVLVMGRAGSGRTCTGALCAYDLIKRGWKAFTENMRPSVGIAPEQVVEEMLNGQGKRLYILDNTHEHRSFYAALLKRFMDARSPDVRLLLLSAPYPRGTRRELEERLSPKTILEPQYLSASYEMTAAVAKHVSTLAGLPCDETGISDARARYRGLWYVTRAVAYSRDRRASRFTAPPTIELAQWQFRRSISPRFDKLEPSERRTWLDSVLLNSIGISPAAHWWDASTISLAERRSIFNRLVDEGLAYEWTPPQGDSRRAYLSVGRPEFCRAVVNKAMSEVGASTTKSLYDTLSDLITAGNSPNVKLIFEKLAAHRRLDVAVQLLNDQSTLRSIAIHLGRLDVSAALQLVESISVCSRRHGRLLLQKLGVEYVARGLIGDPSVTARQVAYSLELVYELDRLTFGRPLAARLAGQDRDSTEAGLVQTRNSFLGETLLDASVGHVGLLIRAVARNNRDVARHLLPSLRERIWATENALKADVTDAPLSDLLALLRGLQITSSGDARRVLHSFNIGALAVRLLPLFGTAGLPFVFGILGKVDPGYLAEMSSYFDEHSIDLEKLADKTLGQLADDLDAIFESAPPVAASLFAAIDNGSLLKMMSRESDLRNIGRALPRIGHANQVKARLFLREVGVAKLAEFARIEPFANAAGGYLLALARVDFSLAREVVNQLDEDVLVAKLTARHLPLSSHSKLIRALALVDIKKATAVHESRWPIVVELTRRSDPPISDVALGLHHLSLALPDEALAFVRRRTNTIRGLLGGSPELHDIVTLLTGLRQCGACDPANTPPIDVLTGAEAWLADLARTNDDPEWIGKYLHVLADVCPAAAMEILRDREYWETLLADSDQIAAIGKVGDLLNGVAKAQRATSELVLTREHEVSLERLMESLADRLKAPRTMLAVRILNAVSNLRESLPDVVDRFVERVSSEGTLTDRALGARTCQELTFFLKAVSHVSPPPSGVVASLLAQVGETSVALLLSNERLIWRIVWLNNALTSFAREGYFDTTLPAGIWQHPDIAFDRISRRFVWERRLQVGAALLRQLHHEVSPFAARDLLRCISREASSNSEVARRAAASNAVDAGALLMITAEIAVGDATSIWRAIDHHVVALQGRSRRAGELAWLALSLERFDAPTARMIAQAAADRPEPDLAAAAFIYAVAERFEVKHSYRPTADEIRRYLRDPVIELVSRAIALRFWGHALTPSERAKFAELLEGGLRARALEHPGDPLFEQVCPPDSSQLERSIHPGALLDHRWSLYDQWWSSPIKWLEPSEDLPLESASEERAETLSEQ